MVGASAAAHNSNTGAIVVNGRAASLHLGSVERLLTRYHEHVARTRGEELARMALTDEPWRRSTGEGSGSRDLGATPLRGIRLT